MGRAIKYPWDEILSQPGETWYFDYEFRNTIRASLAAWAKSKGKKFTTRRVTHTRPDSGDRFFMLEVKLSES